MKVGACLIPTFSFGPLCVRKPFCPAASRGFRQLSGELLAAEADAAAVRSSADLQEVGNYVTALEYGLERLETLPVSLRLVRELHECLMRGVRGDVATPGEFRRSQNWIGPPGCTLVNATYVPPPPSELMACLDSWERFLHDDALPPLVHAALAHAQFEAIHPFLDGNGRVGRLLITLLLVEREVIPSPLLYLSAYLRGHASGILRATSGSDGRRRMGGVADLFPERRYSPVAGRRRSDSAHRQLTLLSGSMDWPGYGPNSRKGHSIFLSRIPSGRWAA